MENRKIVVQFSADVRDISLLKESGPTLEFTRLLLNG
jgi:hypothetical protein